jgi:hypothetical protein
LEHIHIRPLIESKTNTFLHSIPRWYPHHLWYWKHRPGLPDTTRQFNAH